ncbi:GIY-YIG nuclease family protein, partial [Candidatus Gracilibacteria bacterium]|nr:GIY-YIG nuclease family protein [Candidatus Gracilibacteria bacterium]
MSNKIIQNILSKIPKEPGIYKFLCKKGTVLYVGKSVNLKSRVSSYFHAGAKLNFAKKKMISQIADIEYITVNSAEESLILETNLIKELKPKYNILMKDDKNHLYIKITTSEYPQVLRTRIRKNDGEYFGPYTSTYYVDQILRFFKKHFGYGVGTHSFFQKKGGYNLDKYIFQGANTSNSTDNQYRETIEQIRSVLKGNIASLQESLQNKMKTFAQKLQFEEAEKTKQTIEALSTLGVHQIVRESVTGNYNVIHTLEKYDQFFLGFIQIREGKITDIKNYQAHTHLGETINEVLESFIEQKILENTDKKIT